MSSLMLDMALAYARKGMRIFPIHSISNNRCTCGKISCNSAAKHPRTKHGLKDATSDFAQITRWWARWPDANVGIATGSGLAVIDVDGSEGYNQFKQLVAKNNVLPETLVSKTGNGLHFVFTTRANGPEVRSTARLDHIHVRGEGGYIVAPPSLHHSGRRYEWVKQARLGELPDWLRQWTQGYEITAPKTNGALGALPAHLTKYNQRDTSGRLSDSLVTVWSVAEQARLESALQAIPSDRYETWTQVGMALQALRWETNESDLGFELWDAWSQRCPAKYAPASCEEKWKSFGRTRSGVTIGTVYHLAQQHGWRPGFEPLNGAHVVGDKHSGGMNGHSLALPAAFTATPIIWPDTNEKGNPRATTANAGTALNHLGVICRKDLFHEKLLVGGRVIEQYAGDLSDETLLMLRKIIRATYGFDPGDAHIKSGAIQNCLEHQFDPIADYLDSLQWDGVKRLDTWMQTYLRAEATEFVGYVGRLALIAAVRRIRQPGTKFDQIIVLESPQGYGKSEAIEILAGKGNFSDQNILAMKEQAQQEALTGVWLYEMAELSGLRHADIEHVKAFASRTEDRARPAYGRFRVDRQRRTILFASTNDSEYLRDEAGNRRFWPVKTGQVDKHALRRDRDQLWAEAAYLEAQGCSIILPQHLWKVAAEEQEQRLQSDSWLDAINNHLAAKNNPESTTTRDVLVGNALIAMSSDAVKRADEIRAAKILRRLGYKHRRKCRTNVGGFEYRYFRE